MVIVSEIKTNRLLADRIYLLLDTTQPYFLEKPSNHVRANSKDIENISGKKRGRVEGGIHRQV